MNNPCTDVIFHYNDDEFQSTYFENCIKFYDDQLK